MFRPHKSVRPTLFSSIKPLACAQPQKQRFLMTV